MVLRTPDSSIVVPDLTQHQALTWHILECELVTPMYGGGVEAATVDLKMPIRVSAIRGQLRFWWRLLAKNKWKLGDLKTIKKAEFALWGGQGDDDGGRASQVLLKVTQPRLTHHDLVEYTELMDVGHNQKKLSYVLFPAANATDKEINPHKLLKAENCKFQLSFGFSNKLENDATAVQQVLETLRWWANFGALGARTRKGLGAVHVSASTDFPEICHPLSDKEIEAAQCAVVFKGKSSNALTQLYSCIQKLSDFRQKAELGRNKGQPPKPAGRSRWPEPDALRRIKRTHSELHAPEHPADNVFPRAMFGLPIIFHFVGRGEPSDSNLVPIQGDRLASPLFIRPFYLGTNQKGEKEWASCALVTPYEHIRNMMVTIDGRQQYPIWKQDTAQHIRPIQDMNGTDPLHAFLQYFAK